MATAEWGSMSFAGDVVTATLHYDDVTDRAVDLTVVNDGTGTLTLTYTQGAFTASHTFGPGTTVLPIPGNPPKMTKIGNRIQLGSLAAVYD